MQQHPDHGFRDPHLPYYDFDGMPISIGRWIELFEDTENRKLHVDDVELPGGGQARVSTVWLGLDHNYSSEGPPLIFETMVFFEAGAYDTEDFCVRTPTREDAERMHGIACQWAANLGLLPAHASEDDED